MTRREKMAARAITRRRAAQAEAALLDPTDSARFHSVALPDSRRAPTVMTDNPNRGKRHMARLASEVAQDVENGKTRAARPAARARLEIERRSARYSGHDRVPTTYRTQIHGTRRVRNGRGILVPFETQGYTI